MIWAAVVWLTACVPAAPYGDAVPTAAAAAGQPVPINSPVFARRAPAYGRPGYLQTIKYIDDGMKYIDPLSAFFISPTGEMCFRTTPNYPEVIYEAHYRNWCIYPQFVDRVEAATNDITSINEVRLWCMRAYPQCAHAVGEIGQIANSISARTLDYRQERAAVENLVYMMSGNVRVSEPPASDRMGCGLGCRSYADKAIE